MANTLAQLRNLMGFVASRRQRNATDTATAAELCRRPLALPSGLELQWLGTSGFRLSYEGYSVVIDPYLTRIGMREIFRPWARPASAPLVNRFVPGRVDAVLVGHTHFDHAWDTPYLARRDGCKVYGSRSLGALMALYQLQQHWVDVEPYRVYAIGPFEFSFVPSVHSKLVAGFKVPFEGDISCEHFDRLTPSAYACGKVYGIHIAVAGVSFYHQGSADLIDDAIRHSQVDYFLAGIAGRGFSRKYTERILRKLEPRTVVPHHYDDFFVPLGRTLQFSFNVNLSGFVDEVSAVSKDFDIKGLDLLQVARATPPLDA